MVFSTSVKNPIARTSPDVALFERASCTDWECRTESSRSPAGRFQVKPGSLFPALHRMAETCLHCCRLVHLCQAHLQKSQVLFHSLAGLGRKLKDRHPGRTA